MHKLKYCSWNVNGLRACIAKGFEQSFSEINADIFCLQETKLQPGQVELALPGYTQIWSSAEKKGYSGTAVFTRVAPVSVALGIGLPEYDCEGRAITLELEDHYLVNIYAPNAQRELTRLDFRMKWEDALREYVCELAAAKPVLICGDMNVAHAEIDLKNPKTNRGNAGFTDEERGKLTALLESGFVDSFRVLHPESTGAYSWWSYMNHARERNAGWRIDYFVVSANASGRICEAEILPHVLGSDHCPVTLTMDWE